MMSRTECSEKLFSARLLPNSEEPFNAESLLSELVKHEYTPEELMHCRDHSERSYQFSHNVIMHTTLNHTSLKLCTTSLRRCIHEGH